MAPPVKAGKGRESEETDAPSNNLWVGNLAADTMDADLVELFAKYGELDSVATYSSRSYAFVYFKRVEDAAAAKDALQGTSVRGNALKIEFARPAKPSKHLWVGGISAAVTKEQLEEEFLKFGKIEDFKFLRERDTAFIEYFKLEDASQALKNMNGNRIGGDQIRVDFLRSRREQFPEFHDPRESQFSVTHPAVRRQHAQSTGARKEGQPSNVLWVGYPPSVQIDEQMLHNAMILFGEIERIKSFPSRHYSFVEFRSVDEARRAKEGLQGRLFNDPRITIMFSSSEVARGKDYSSGYPGVRVPRPDMLNERPFGPGQMELLEHHHSTGLSFPGSLNSQRPNLPLRSLGPQGGLDPSLPGSEFNDLASMHGFHDGNPSIPMGMGPNWRRQSPPASGILPSPGATVRPQVRSASTGWDVLDSSQFQREPKRSRIDAPSPIDDDPFPSRRIDDRRSGLDKEYGYGPEGDVGVLGSFGDVQRKHSLSPVRARTRIGGPFPGRVDVDFTWRGIIAKGGTPVCHARCVPIGKGIDSELPEVVNCSARTGLDMLTKHYAEAIGFDIVFFLPDSEDDFASYTEFLRYLGSKDRAGVAKFEDGTTLFLVPPSDFLTKVLKIAGPERLYGVVLKLPQQVPSSGSIQPQLRHPLHLPQHIDRHQISSLEADHNLIRQTEEHMLPVNYNKVFHEDSKIPSKSFYSPATESILLPSAAQNNGTSNTEAASQPGVSLTPELIATLVSFLPSNAQTSAESGQQALGTSTIRPSFSSIASDTQVSGNLSHLQVGNQFNSQVQAQSQFQSYTYGSSVSSHSVNVVPGSSQIQDFKDNQPQQGAIPSRPLPNFGVPPQSTQFALPAHVSQQYQLEAAHGTQKGYGMAHGADVLGSYSPSVLQHPHALSSQVLGANYSQSQSGIQFSAERVNWEIPNQVQQLQTAPAGPAQSTSEGEVDKNQRYQSTLQFAANLLLQIQQQQQHQTSTPAGGAGNQQ